MIELVNKTMVPVWVNIRSDEYPTIPATLDQDAWSLLPGPDGQVFSLYALGFWARSYILSPDTRTLYNEDDGMLGQANLPGDDYYGMLERSVKAYELEKRKRAKSQAAAAVIPKRS